METNETLYFILFIIFGALGSMSLVIVLWAIFGPAYYLRKINDKIDRLLNNTNGHS